MYKKTELLRFPIYLFLIQLKKELVKELPLFFSIFVSENADSASATNRLQLNYMQLFRCQLPSSCAVAKLWRGTAGRNRH